MTLKQKQEMVSQFEVITRLEEEQSILLNEMGQYVKNLKQSAKQNEEKLCNKDKGEKALLARQMAIFNSSLSEAIEIFQRLTEGNFITEVRPNDDIDMLMEEYSEVQNEGDDILEYDSVLD